MRIEATGTGKTIEDAIRAACEKLGVDRDDVEVEVLTAPTKKVLGFMGGSNAEVLAFYDDGKPEEAPAKVEAPVEKGQKLGTVYFETDGKVIASCPIINENYVERRNWFFVFCALWSSFAKK